jgi:hypothetical protein
VSLLRREVSAPPVSITVACEHRTTTVRFNARPDEPAQEVFFGAARALIYACPACAFDATHWVDDHKAFVFPGDR